MKIQLRGALCKSKCSRLLRVLRNTRPILRFAGLDRKVRGSLVRLDDGDGELLAGKLRAQAENGKLFPIDEQEKRKLATHTVVRSDKVVNVSVPDDSGPSEEASGLPEAEGRESIRIEALLGNIGEQMGMSVWIPKADRNPVLREWHPADGTLLENVSL